MRRSVVDIVTGTGGECDGEYFCRSPIRREAAWLDAERAGSQETGQVAEQARAPF